MDLHVKVVAWGNIAIGLAGFVAAVGALMLLGLDFLWGLPRFGLAAVGLVVLNLFLSVPCVIGGRGLLLYRPWARTLIILTSTVNVLNVPVASILAAYGLWTLTQFETEPLFNQQMPRQSSLRN